MKSRLPKAEPGTAPSGFFIVDSPRMADFLAGFFCLKEMHANALTHLANLEFPKRLSTRPETYTRPDLRSSAEARKKRRRDARSIWTFTPLVKDEI
jgi:hypothetical protein